MSWSSEKLAHLERELVVAREQFAAAETIHRAWSGGEIALIRAGIPVITAERLVREASVFGYRDQRPKHRRAIRILEARIAGIKQWDADHGVTP